MSKQNGQKSDEAKVVIRGFIALVGAQNADCEGGSRS